jgi:hypothetical protein
MKFPCSEFWLEQGDIDLYKIFSCEKWPKFSKFWKKNSTTLDFYDKLFNR